MLVSLPLARHDADWWIDQLYAFAGELGATTVHTAISRTVIDVNRDPSGASLYPGQATTGPRARPKPSTASRSTATAERRRRRRSSGARQLYFEPYHAALAAEIARLRAPASAHRALRLPLDPLGHPAPVRRRAAGVQHRHQRRARAATCDWKRRVARRLRGERVVARGQRPLQGRLDHPPLRPAGRRRARRADGARAAAATARRASDAAALADARRFAKPIRQTLARGARGPASRFARGRR